MACKTSNFPNGIYAGSCLILDKGVVIEGNGQRIVNVSSYPYNQVDSEDILICTGSGDVNLIDSDLAYKELKIISIDGTITPVPVGGESLIGPPTVTAGKSAVLTPYAGTGWVAS